MNTLPSVAVIVLSWNGERFLNACLEAVLAQTYPGLEVLVVDNASTDQSAAIVQAFAPRVRLIEAAENLGFAGGNNVGVRATQADIVILLNQDTVVQPGWLQAMVEPFTNEEVGIVGGKGLYPDGKTIQHAGAWVKPGDASTEHIGVGQPDDGQFNQLADMDYVTGASFAIHRRVLESLGGLDEAYYPAFYEEVDYCYRARRAGFRVVYQPQAVFLHYESASLAAQNYARLSALHRNRLRFVMRHWAWPELTTFGQVEQVDNTRAGWTEDVAARARAYFDALLNLGAVVAQRQVDATLGGPLSAVQARQFFAQLQKLREQALLRLSEVATPMPSTAGLAGQVAELVQVLEDRSVPVENPAPVSQAGVLGPIITRLRAAWLAVMVRPYLIPLLEQQWDYNRRLAQTLREVSRQTAAAQWQAMVLSADDAALFERLQRALENED